MEQTAKPVIVEPTRTFDSPEHDAPRSESPIGCTGKGEEPHAERNSASIPLLSLPPEILIKILLSLSPEDLLACKLSTRYLHNLIRDSAEVQYHATLLSFGAEDNPHSSLPLPEKIRSIRRTEKAWATVEPDFSLENAEVPDYPAKWYDIMDGVFFWSDSGSSAVNYLRLPQKEDDEVVWKSYRSEKWIVAFTASLYEHDLIVLVTTTPAGAGEDGRMSFRMQLHFVEFSTGKPHPKARDPLVFVMDTYFEEPMTFLQVVGPYLTFVTALDGENDTILVINWQANYLIMRWQAPRGNYLGHRFITEDLIVFANKRDLTLDIFRIPPKPDLSTPRPVLVLSLPAIAEGYNVESFHLCVKPTPKSTRPQEEHSSYERTGSLPTRSYLANADDAIFIFRIQVNFCFTFVMHRRALVDLVEEYESLENMEDLHSEAEGGGDQVSTEKGSEEPSEAGEKVPDSVCRDFASQTSPPTLPYSLWGPRYTRWFSPRRYVMVLTTWGQRHIQLGAKTDGRGAPILVLDFNLARVKQFESKNKGKAKMVEDQIPQSEGLAASNSDGEAVPSSLPELAFNSEVDQGNASNTGDTPMEDDLPNAVINQIAENLLDLAQFDGAEIDQMIPKSGENIASEKASDEAASDLDVSADETTISQELDETGTTEEAIVLTRCVSSMDRVEPAEVFAEPVWSSLPYVVSESKKRYSFNDVIMDEERVIGLEKDFWGFVDSINILHIG